jgi:hypothetical protein
MVIYSDPGDEKGECGAVRVCEVRYSGCFLRSSGLVSSDRELLRLLFEK